MTGDEFRSRSDTDRCDEDERLPPVTGVPLVAAPAPSFGMAGFLPGTLIASTEGEIPVESFRPGMRIVALGGEVITVVKIGHRHIVPRLHPKPASVHPVRLLRDAIADGVPAQDLIVGPGQILFLSGTSIPARFLINGGTVFIDPCWSGVDYFHLALASPGRPLAQLVPVDACDSVAARRAFGIDDVVKLHPGLALFDVGPSVLADAVQQLLKRRAIQKGVSSFPDPDLRPPAPFSII